MMKRQDIYFKGAVALEHGEMAAEGEAAEARNVREAKGALIVTGVPATVGAIPDGHRLLLYDHGVVVTCDADGAVEIDGQAVGTFAAGVVAAHIINDLVVVVCGDGLRSFARADDQWQELVTDDALPTITLAATDATTLRADIAAIEFKEPYTRWQAPLADADRATVRKLVADAWSDLLSDHHAARRHAAPLLARWAVRLTDGTYLWASEPVRIGDDTLANNDWVVAEVVNNDDGYIGTDDTTMTMLGYSIGASAEGSIPALWQSRIASIDVFVTDEPSLVAAGNTLDYRCHTDATTGDKLLRARLTPASDAAISAALAASGWTLALRATDLDTLAFAVPATTETLTNDDFAAIAEGLTFTDVACSAAVNGRVYVADGAGNVAMTAAGNPLVEDQRTRLLGVTTYSLAAVSKPLYSSGLGRYPVYAFTDDGIYAIPMSSGGKLVEPRLIDRRVIHEDIGACVANRDVFFIDRHGTLCVVSGIVVTEVFSTDAGGLAWCSRYNELWMTHDGGYAEVLLPSRRRSVRTIALLYAYSTPRCCIGVLDGGTLVSMEQEEASATMPVRYESHPILEDPLLGASARRVAWSVYTTEAQLTLAVEGLRGTCGTCATTMGRVELRGATSTPLAMALPAWQFRSLRLVVAGTAATATKLLFTSFYFHA